MLLPTFAMADPWHTIPDPTWPRGNGNPDATDMLWPKSILSYPITPVPTVLQTVKIRLDIEGQHYFQQCCLQCFGFHCDILCWLLFLPCQELVLALVHQKQPQYLHIENILLYEGRYLKAGVRFSLSNSSTWSVLAVKHSVQYTIMTIYDFGFPCACCGEAVT